MPPPQAKKEKVKIDPKKHRMCLILLFIGGGILFSSLFLPFYKLEWQDEVKYLSLVQQGHLISYLSAFLGFTIGYRICVQKKSGNFEAIWVYLATWGCLAFSFDNFEMKDGVFRSRPAIGVLVYLIGIIFMMIASSVYKRAEKAVELDAKK